ncbi:MAG TPA: SCO family protein [Thermoanaerobaculia bacterium]
MRKLLPLFLLLLAVPSFAQQGPAATYFKDIVLTDQHGKRVRLYEDVMKGHTVVMNSFFATCTGSCPVMTKTYLALQERYADRLGKDLRLVSITVDPQTDTPSALLEYARRAKAKNGWFLLTGSKEEVELALKKIGQYAENREAHKNVMIIGNDRTGLWKKAFALAKTNEVAAVVDSVLNDKGL